MGGTNADQERARELIASEQVRKRITEKGYKAELETVANTRRGDVRLSIYRYNSAAVVLAEHEDGGVEVYQLIGEASPDTASLIARIEELP